MDDNSPHKLSTSALAKRLQIPSQQLFTTLKDYGWINKLDEGWALSGKGEFEGGEYVHSKRYGRYIVWPDELAEHPLFRALEDNRHVSATALAKAAGINARQVNRIFSELGWIRHGFQGWELTTLGEDHGGVQLENENSGTSYVVWPQSIQSRPVLKTQLALAGELFGDKPVVADDLFAMQGQYQCLDGHRHDSKSMMQICYWLYMAGIAHACQRRLPVDEELYADFYLPSYQLYIECWQDETGRGLSQRMQRKAVYQQYGFALIEVEKDDFLHLDDALTRQFRKQGIRV